MEHKTQKTSGGGDGDSKTESNDMNSPSSSVNDDGSQYSGDDSDEYKEVTWDPETEICLFESIAKYPPIGVNRYFSILNSTIYMQKHLNKRITPQQTYEHLQQLYNLEALEDNDDLDTQTVDFNLPSEYAPLMEERIRKEHDSDETTPANKRRRQDKDKEKDKDKDKHEDEGKSRVKTEVESPTSPSGSKYATFSEFIHGALIALGGVADLQTLYNYVAEHSQEVDKKYASRFENGVGKSSVGYKSNVRSTLHNNQCFVKLPNGQWTISSGTKKK